MFQWMPGTRRAAAEFAGTKPLDVRSIRFDHRQARGGRRDPRPDQRSLAAGGLSAVARGRRRRSGRAAAGRRLEGAADAGPLRAAPVRRPRRGRQAALPGRSVEGAPGRRRGGVVGGDTTTPHTHHPGPENASESILACETVLSKGLNQAAVAAYLTERAESAAPATVRMDRAPRSPQPTARPGPPIRAPMKGCAR